MPHLPTILEHYDTLSDEEREEALARFRDYLAKQEGSKIRGQSSTCVEAA